MALLGEIRLNEDISALISGDIIDDGTTTTTTTWSGNKINSDKQNTLVSATNIKTVNSETLLGSGNIVVAALASPTFTGLPVFPALKLTPQSSIPGSPVEGVIYYDDGTNQPTPAPYYYDGAVWNIMCKLKLVWDVHNFGGFWYDITDDLGLSKLSILQTNLAYSQRVISANNLEYFTKAEFKVLDVVRYGFGGNVANAATAGLLETGAGLDFENGGFYIMGWAGTAHYLVNRTLACQAEYALLQDPYDTVTKSVGGTWNFGLWSIALTSIDTKSGNCMFTVNYDGSALDSNVVKNNHEIYTLKETFGGIANVPTLVFYISNIYAGDVLDFVDLKYGWAVVRTALDYAETDIIDALTITDLDETAKSITAKNTSALTLTENTDVLIIEDIYLRVADQSATLRFMPVKTGTIEIHGEDWSE